MKDGRAVVVVLAVDDETLNSELLQRAFHARGDVQLLTVASGGEALKIVAEQDVDLMLVDQSMPQMSGVELMRRVRLTGKVPICVMVTAYPEMKEVLEAWQAGLVRYIVPKPWRSAELLSTVDRALSRLP